MMPRREPDLVQNCSWERDKIAGSRSVLATMAVSWPGGQLTAATCGATGRADGGPAARTVVGRRGLCRQVFPDVEADFARLVQVPV